MAVQPPRFKARGAPVRVAWARPMFQLDLRKRGRAGQRDRAQVLAEEPLCRICLDEGRTSASVVVDHVTPLSDGGSDLRDNKQGLCKSCHDRKSAGERAARRSGR